MRISVAIGCAVLAACAQAGAPGSPPDTENPCASGQVRCGGACIDPMTDPDHCGASGDCEDDRAGASCEATSTCQQGTCSAACMAVTTTFQFLAAMQTYAVPPGVTRVRLDASGAQGADANGGITPGTGGRGGQAIGTLAVAPGQQLLVFVGGRAGFNGGGLPGAGSSFSGNGGGASDVRTGASAGERVIVAGGGGGGSAGAQGTCTAGAGGVGGMAGGDTGATGTTGTGCGTTSTGGTGGTASAGGTGGTPGSNCSLTAGSGVVGGAAAGGKGGDGTFCNGAGFRGAGGGGGGAGYFGGGGGAGGPGGSGGSWGGGGGGGGSSFVGTLTDTSMTPGVRTGDGVVAITTICP